MTTTFSPSDLAQFTGCVQPLKDSLIKGIIYTEGVKFLRDNGCNWLVVDILTSATMESVLKDQEFISVLVDSKNETISFVGLDSDGDEVELFRKDDYICFDVPTDLTLFVGTTYQESGPVKILMLSSEY